MFAVEKGTRGIQATEERPPQRQRPWSRAGRSHDMQTEVLRALHDWSRPVEIKLRALSPPDERLGLLEERVSRF